MKQQEQHRQTKVSAIIIEILCSLTKSEVGDSTIYLHHEDRLRDFT